MPDKLTCPFCGSNDIRFTNHGRIVHPQRDLWSTCCYPCGATFPNRYSKETLIRCWQARPNGSELNPQHPVTESVHDQWHKIVALLMIKHGWTKTVITHKDIEALINRKEGTNVTICEKEDGVHLELVDNKTAHLLANS